MIVIPPSRGIQLGRPELMKTWEKFEHKKSTKAEKGKSSVDSELESRFRSISQKQEDFEKQKETEATKPEFMRVSLKKSSREVEATSWPITMKLKPNLRHWILCFKKKYKKVPGCVKLEKLIANVLFLYTSSSYIAVFFGKYS